jgi:hypothetical protein
LDQKKSGNDAGRGQRRKGQVKKNADAAGDKQTHNSGCCFGHGLPRPRNQWEDFLLAERVLSNAAHSEKKEAPGFPEVTSGSKFSAGRDSRRVVAIRESGANSLSIHENRLAARDCGDQTGSHPTMLDSLQRPDVETSVAGNRPAAEPPRTGVRQNNSKRKKAGCQDLIRET